MLKKKKINSWFPLILAMCILFTFSAPISTFSDPGPAATVGNVDVIGTAGSAITPKDVVVTIANDAIVPAGIVDDTDLASWITNLPAGLAAKAKGAVAGSATSVTIEITGTPAAALSAPLTIVIPAAQLVSNAPLTVAANADAKFTIVPAPAATVGNVNVIGTAGSAITPKDVVVTIANDAIVPAGIVDDTDLASWITNLPAGLAAEAKGAVAGGATSVTIEITGTPAAALSAPLTIVIPAAQLVSNAPLTVTANADAKFTVVSSGSIYDISQGNITIIQGDDPATQVKVTHGAGPVTTGNLDKTQEIIIIGSTTAYTIIADNVEAKVTLNGVSINANTLGKSPFLLQNNSSVELTVLNSNTLAATNTPSTASNFAGLQVNPGNTLTITAGSTGSLTASGGNNGAGIGGGNAASGTVIINGGTIEALAGYNGAGIGGGASSGGGIITINGGTVTAKGNVEGPGIGTGYSNGVAGNSTITINGGTVTAIGGSCSPSGIGGPCGGGPQNITISSAANVKVVSRPSGRAVYAVGGQLASGSTANVLMANFSVAKVSGTEVQVVNRATDTVVSTFSPNLNNNSSFSSIAFTVNDNSNYSIKVAGAVQQHSSPASADFTMEADSRLKQFNQVTNLTFSVISPTARTFDKKTDQQADVTTTMTLNGNTLSAIKNGAATLVDTVDYTVAGSVVTIKKGYLAAQAVGTTNLTFEFSAGASQTLTVTISDTTPAAPAGGGGGGGGGTSTPAPTEVIVIVNGETQNAGKEVKTVDGGRSVITVQVNPDTIEKKIEETKGLQDNVIQIPVKETASDVARVELTGDIVKKLEDATFDISVKRDSVEYIIPAEEMTIDGIAEKLGVPESALRDIKVEIQITKLPKDTVEKYEAMAAANGGQLIFPPVSFEITAKATAADGTVSSVKVDRFSNYVERVMEIPAGVDPSKITTGIVFNADGTYEHVPTVVFQRDGKWYAKLNSLTNSNYSVLWNPVTVKSVAGHWSEKAVNDMASRLVIADTAGFLPDKAITRSEFADYIVKALGVYRKVAVMRAFPDVYDDDPHKEAIYLANSYGIIKGYPDGTFRGDGLISREEAMAMYVRAMAVADFIGKENERFMGFDDYTQVSDWAKEDVKSVLAARVFNGVSASSLAPKANLTHAEAITAIRNLLTESGLINR